MFSRGSGQVAGQVAGQDCSRGSGHGGEGRPRRSHKGPGGGGRAERAAAAALMGMLSLPGFLSCGKKKVRLAGGTRQVRVHLSRGAVEVPRWP